MRILVLLLCCIGASLGDSQADSSEVSSTSTKQSLSKTNLNSIPNGSSQKTTLIQQPQHQQQYVPQYVVQQKQQGPPAAMFIIGNPGNAPQSPLFQQAVSQLLNYYQNNPQARYQLLQQQGGVPQGTYQPGSYQQPSFHQAQMPSGALHVIPSPQLDSNGAAPNQHHAQSGQPQAIYAIPAQSQFALTPAILAQLGIQASPAQHIPVQLSPQHVQVPAHQFFGQQQIPAQQYSAQQFSAQSIPAHQLQAQHIPAQQFAAQYTHQLPAQFAIASQFPGGYQQQSQFGSNIHLGNQGQFGLKQNVASQLLNTNEYVAQSDKSQTSSSNYSPVFKTAYVKG